MNKVDNIHEENGHSMIEMLGVLAIIGILSVGGIAGYSKAMMKIKINKTIDQITQISQNIRVFFHNQKSYYYVGWSTINKNLFEKAHLLPDGMKFNEDGSLQHSFGGALAAAWAEKEKYSDYKAFSITIEDIPEEACIAIASHDWSSASGLFAMGINSYNRNQYVGCTGVIGTSMATACSGGTKVSIPMPINIATNACLSGSNNIWFKFY